jgi:EmrB/QacA subfamily drug resistance transporter
MTEPVTTHQPGPARALDRGILLTAAVVVSGMLLAILDATIVNVAIPTLGGDFNTSISTIQWVMTGYLLAFAASIPLTGWAAGRFGAKRVWTGALVGFMAGSALSGAAWSIDSLIAFRILQGTAAGMLVPVGQLILAQAAGRERIGRVMSIVGVPMLLGPVFGPVIGGAIVDGASWRWIFFVNLPVGVLALALAWRILPGSAPRPGGRLDLRGLALLPPGLALLVYGMSEAGARGGFGSGRALTGISAGLVLVAAFAVHAWRRGSAALIDVTLFARRGFAGAALTNLLVGVALFGALVLLPLYYQVVRGETALSTGLLLVPQGIGAALAMPVAGFLTDRIGARTVIPVGALIALIGTAGFTQVGADTPYALLGGWLFVIGLGLGATIMPSMAVAYQSVPQESMAQATSAISVVQRIAGSVGTALLAVVLQHSIAGNLPRAGGGLGALLALPVASRAHVAAPLADAFGTAFTVAAGLVGLALATALLLPGRPLPRIWRFRCLLGFEAAAFALAATVHFGALVHGYGHTAAGRAESVIALVLLAGLGLSFTRARILAVIGAQVFGTLGVLVGLFTIAIGVGPRTGLDLAYHAVILAVLVAGLVLAVREWQRSCRRPDMIRRCRRPASSEHVPVG